ncbi:MAG: ABC transporter ATP-binding protein [Tissierellaceae bacterium]
MISLETRDLIVNYGKKVALDGVDIKIDLGSIVSIIGPNGSGKSTLLKALSRCIRPAMGKIILNGSDIYTLNNREIAREMAILPQMKNVSSDITVENLVSYGRYPHLGFGKRLSTEDREIVKWAMERTGLIDYRDRYINTLSGGERQRAWISMALAQKPKILLLDEPTTYLDISYQLEILELIKELNTSLDLTVVMVLHDLNQAARYSDYIYVLNHGKVCENGKPENIIKRNILEDVFRIEAHIYSDEVNSCPYFIPYRII